MAKGSGKSGQQVAEEHARTLAAVLAAYADKALPRHGVDVNRSALATECGFDRKVFRDNPRCAVMLRDADELDRVHFLDGLTQAELKRDDKAKTDEDRAELETRILDLMAENASLKRELERFRRLERLMLDTGKLPS